MTPMPPLTSLLQRTLSQISQRVHGEADVALQFAGPDSFQVRGMQGRRHVTRHAVGTAVQRSQP